MKVTWLIIQLNALYHSPYYIISMQSLKKNLSLVKTNPRDVKPHTQKNQTNKKKFQRHI